MVRGKIWTAKLKGRQDGEISGWQRDGGFGDQGTAGGETNVVDYLPTAGLYQLVLLVTMVINYRLRQASTPASTHEPQYQLQEDSNPGNTVGCSTCISMIYYFYTIIHGSHR